MRKFIVILVAVIGVLLINACKQEEKSIEFVKITDVDLGNLKRNNATLNGIAVFRNSSKTATFTMQDMLLDFTIDGKSIGTIVVKNNRNIESNTEFSIPFSYKYDTDKILEAGSEPATVYAVQLLGELRANTNEKQESAEVKYAESYEYKTAKEERIEKRKERKEERIERREQRKEKRQNIE